MPFSSSCHLLSVRELNRKWSSRAWTTWTGSPKGEAGATAESIDEIGLRLESFPHHRLKGSNGFRARVGDYRIIYTFDVEQNRIHMLAIGHRREIYRS